MNIKKILCFLGITAAVVSAKDYSGAELYTRDIYQYGKFEARMMMAVGSGIVSSMFLYHNDSYLGGSEPWVEVDTEVLGKNPNSFQSNIITGSAEKKVTSEQHHSISPAVNEAYHTYAFEWTPTYVSWIVDGVEVRRTQVDSSDTKNQVQALVRAQGLRFNLWASEDPGWVGPWDESILPVHQYINWVKVYSYTPGQGENGTDFTLEWVDNFDTYDQSRWAEGNWSFDGNRVDLVPENIEVVNGTLVISLTKTGQEGFNGTVPQDVGESAEPPVAPEEPNSIGTKRPIEKNPNYLYKKQNAVKVNGVRINENRAGNYTVKFHY